MYTADGPPLPGESPEVGALRDRSERLVRMVLELGARPGEGTVRRLVGLGALVDQLRLLEPQAESGSRVMRPQYAFDPEDPGLTLARRARARGVDTELITRSSTVRTHPLLSSIFPRALLGPVFLRALLLDQRHAIVGGPDDAEGNAVSWYTTEPAVVSALCDLWHVTVRRCTPILAPGERPPLSERQLDVARLLCVGEKDTVIARTLNLSARTVEREVSALLGALGAGSRAEAVLLMCGRGVNGGWAGGSAQVPVSRRITW